MSFFTEKDFAEVRSRDAENEQMRDDAERCKKNYTGVRNTLIENLVYGFNLFERVVKDYPQLASLKHVKTYHVETSKYGLFGRPKRTQHDLIPLNDYYNHGFIHDVQLYAESGIALETANLFVDQKGTLLYCCSKNFGEKEVGLYSSAQFRQLLEKVIKPSNYNAMQDVEDSLGWHIRLDDSNLYLLIGRVVSLTFGASCLIEHPKYEKTYWIETYPFFASLKVERLSDDEIISNIKEYLKTL